MSTRTALQSPYLCARFYPCINAEQGGKKVGEIWHFCFALLLFVDSGSTLSITVSLHKKLHHLKIKGLSSHFFFLFMNSIEFPQGHISPGSLVCFVLWSCSYLPLSHCRVWEEEISSTPGKRKTFWSTECCWLNTFNPQWFIHNHFIWYNLFIGWMS